MLLGAMVLTLLVLAIGYVLATIYFAVQYGYSTRSFDLTLLARIHTHIHGRAFLNCTKSIVLPQSWASFASERMG